MNKIISRKRTLQIIVILCILGVTIYGLRFIDFKQVLQQVEKLPFFLKSITMILFIMLQVVFALFPGEPLELASGFLFGNFYGTLLCLAGSCLGTFFVYYLVKFFKHKIINLFFSKEKVQEVEQMHFKKQKQVLDIFNFSCSRQSKRYFDICSKSWEYKPCTMADHDNTGKNSKHSYFYVFVCLFKRRRYHFCAYCIASYNCHGHTWRDILSL